MTTTTILAAEEATRGWGGPVALLLAVVAFVAFATLLDAWQRRQEDHSPTEDDDTDAGVKPQVRAVSDTDDTTGDTDTASWWGRIVSVDGRRVRQVWRTGSSRLPDDDVDLALDDDGGDEPAAGASRPETIERMIVRLTEQGIPYAGIVRRLQSEYRISESTAKRRIKQVRERMPG